VAEIIHIYQDEAKRLEYTLDFAPLHQAFETSIERHIALLSQDAGHARRHRQALEVTQELTLGLNPWRV
jgi:hypothetical protein